MKNRPSVFEEISAVAAACEEAHPFTQKKVTLRHLEDTIIEPINTDTASIGEFHLNREGKKNKMETD